MCFFRPGGVVMNTKFASFSLLAFVLSLSACVTEASAAPEPGAPIKNKATWKVVDSNEKGEAYTLDWNGGAYQKWIEVYAGSRQSVTLSNQATGRCLDSNAEGKVYTLPCNGGAYQVWRK